MHLGGLCAQHRDDREVGLIMEACSKGRRQQGVSAAARTSGMYVKSSVRQAQRWPHMSQG